MHHEGEKELERKGERAHFALRCDRIGRPPNECSRQSEKQSPGTEVRRNIDGRFKFQISRPERRDWVSRGASSWTVRIHMALIGPVDPVTSACVWSQVIAPRVNFPLLFTLVFVARLSSANPYPTNVIF